MGSSRRKSTGYRRLVKELAKLAAPKQTAGYIDRGTYTNIDFDSTRSLNKLVHSLTPSQRNALIKMLFNERWLLILEVINLLGETSGADQTNLIEMAAEPGFASKLSMDFDERVREQKYPLTKKKV